MRFIPIRRYLSAEMRSSSNASGLLSGKTPENVKVVLTGRGGGGSTVTGGKVKIDRYGGFLHNGSTILTPKTKTLQLVAITGE